MKEDVLRAHKKVSHILEVVSDISLWIELIEEFRGKTREKIHAAYVSID